MKSYYVYIVGSDSGTLYIGMTNNLERRIYEHKHGLLKGFTKKYNCNKLLYFEEWWDIQEVIKREKQLKWWTRKKKEDLINVMNPHWKDLSRV